MKRRVFLHKSLQSVPYLAFMPSWLSCSKSDDPGIETDKQVIVIGGGISGLAAARYLKDRGVDVKVLEAQDRVGGRIKTDRSLGIPFDMGASWIHGQKGNPIRALANQANASTYLTDDDNVVVYDIDGSTYPDKLLDAEEGLYDELLEMLDGDLNVSFEEAFYSQHPQYQNNRLWTYMLSAYLEFDTGSDIGSLSSQDFYDDEAFSGKDRIITNGFDRLTDFLAEGLEVLLNAKVTSIDSSKELVQLESSLGNFEADHVLITVPLGVLQQNIISFQPQLPASLSQSISKLKMGCVNKFLCLWDAPFWDTNLQYIGYTAQQKGKFNHFMNVGKFSKANGLMAFCFGDYATATESMTDSDVIEEMMVHLRVIYGKEIPNPIQMLRTKWLSNEYAFGSYSFVASGSRSSDIESFEDPVDNKLFFAGEHTSRDYRGAAHGAYLSGLREAEKIAALL